jgi:hypothetical protein
MQTYSQFRPTGFDTKGLGLDDRQDWLVLPISQTRDSGTLDESNFAVAQRMLDDGDAEYEVHRFGHWGPGWFEIILVHPSHATLAETIHVDDYPILDDSDYSEREYAAACKWWGQCGMRERVRLSKKYRFHLMACRRDEIPQDETGELVSYLADGC